MVRKDACYKDAMKMVARYKDALMEDPCYKNAM